MKPDTKKAAALIIALGKKPKQPEGEGYEDESEEGEVDEGKLSCAEDILDALDNKDPEALVRALDAFLDQR